MRVWDPIEILDAASAGPALRDAPEEIATHQIDRICTPRLISTEGLLTAPNGW